jgi:hypothetical protein
VKCEVTECPLDATSCVVVERLPEPMLRRKVCSVHVDDTVDHYRAQLCAITVVALPKEATL